MALLMLTAASCSTTLSAPPMRSPLEPLPLRARIPPDDVDHLAADMAEAVLADDADRSEVTLALAQELEAERIAQGDGPTGMIPYLIDARIALEDDEFARRAAAEEILERDDLEPELRFRLEREVADDPIKLAAQRIHEARMIRWGSAANLLSAAAGTSISQPQLLPVKVGAALLQIALGMHMADELSPQERQALVYWKEIVEEDPDHPVALSLKEPIEATEARWAETKRDQAYESAVDALEAGAPASAASFATRALHYEPEDSEATEVLLEAQAQLSWFDAERTRSLGADPAGLAPEASGGELLRALLLPDTDVEPLARKLLEAHPKGPRADEARFILAIAAFERGDEVAGWEGLEELAREDDEDASMARHAHALFHDLNVNPYRGFELARRKKREEGARWLFLGPLAGGVRDRNLPLPVELLVEATVLPKVVTGFPGRLIKYPMRPTEARAGATMARRYLERYPEGVHQRELQEWLLDYELDRDNMVGAYKLAAQGSLLDTEDLEELRQEAAMHAFETSLRETRFDVRVGLLMDVAQEFPGTEGAQKAGMLAREEIGEASPQKIRITKGFLLEHPEVAGPQGLALRPGLLDDEPANGELHSAGIVLLGGRVLEFNFLGESGKESDEPVQRREHVSQERLERVAVLLESESNETLRTDRDAKIEPDADRDVFLERARLGLTDTVDFRPDASSEYTFRGMRERYGLVRGRESILPVELVLQGSFEDFGLGAFPRLRMPKSTPDQFLYRE
jgi:hypothetical protein